LSTGVLIAACSLLVACATIPRRDYGVRSLEISGVKQLDESALKVCLATQARERFGFSFGVADTPECGVPPFDASRLPVSFWAWPWTDWPLYDETVWNRDIARVSRWYRARGYYDAQVVQVTQKPDPEHKTIDLALQVVENQPVLVQRIEMEGIQAVDRRLRNALQAALQLRVGERFDEALYDESKRALVAALRERAYALAEVSGAVSIDTRRHTADVTFRVQLGRRYRFGEVTVEGEGSLPKRPVWAAAEIEEGTPFSVSALDDAKRAIYELGPFASVELIEKPHKDSDRIDILIKVVPGRRLRTAIGIGMQVGTDPTLTPTDATYDSLNRWDVHLLGRVEHRNFLGGMRRLAIEDRPRLIFNTAFPSLNERSIGNLLIVDFRQPTFFEARTSFLMTARWDRGPDPYTNVPRSDLLAGLGPERTFLNGKLRTSITANVNWFVPDDPSQVSTLTRVSYPAYSVTYMQYALALDLRDQPRDPRRGAYFALTVQQAGYFLPGNWDYVRITPDVRGYLPLGRAFVLAGRARIGIMEITESTIEVGDNDAFGIRERLRDLGPLRQRLRGGGNNSVRGYRPNTLGDVTRIGDIVDSGGLRQWEASLELRTAITAQFGVVFFVDVGDVSRRKVFRLNAPQPSFGIGLRYRTVIGPIRLDAGFAPPPLQVVGADPRVREAMNPDGSVPATRPYHESQLLGTQGALHFTIGEAY